jgi:hypothetical protein
MPVIRGKARFFRLHSVPRDASWTSTAARFTAQADGCGLFRPPPALGAVSNDHYIRSGETAFELQLDPDRELHQHELLLRRPLRKLFYFIFCTAGMIGFYYLINYLVTGAKGSFGDGFAVGVGLSIILFYLATRAERGQRGRS